MQCHSPEGYMAVACSFGSVPYTHANDVSLYGKLQAIFGECKLMRLGGQSTFG